jgi:glycerol kinase
MIEAMGFQVRDVLETMAATGTAPSLVRVDGGAAVMGLLLQHLADQARLEVVRPQSVETTALGAATMAGLAEGVWGSLDDLATLWSAEATFTPEADPALAELAHAAWTRSVGRSRGWATGGDPG